MKILFIAAECAPAVKVGGLADVVGSLPKALKKLGVDVAVAIPFYDSIKLVGEPQLFRPGLSVSFQGGEKGCEIWESVLPSAGDFQDESVPLFLIKAGGVFAQNIYFEKDATPQGSEKEALSFLFLSAVGGELAKILGAKILHCHDWHTALAPFLVKRRNYKVKTILTIHNLEYQGRYEAALVNRILSTDFSGDFNCLRQGISDADFITTVSPTYSREILTEKFGAGLQNALKMRSDELVGILNGLDIAEFNPQKDAALKDFYSADNFEGKETNKKFLQEKFFGKSDASVPVLALISRLTAQKGIDLVVEIFNSLMAENMQFVLLGQGAELYEKIFLQKAKGFPAKFSAHIGFDEKLARQIYAGADIFLMPSLFEPCGLGQQIAMRYGTVPVARAVGGIKDTVEDIKAEGGKLTGAGVLFEQYNAAEFLSAIKKAFGFYQNKAWWRQIAVNGMKKDFSWDRSAREYIKLYRRLAGSISV